MTLRIAYENHIDGAVVTADTSFDSLPASNLKDQDIQRLWRSPASTAFLIADIGSIQTLGVIALINVSAVASDTVRVRASTSDATVTSALSYDSGVIGSGVDALYAKVVHFIEPSVSYRYLRLDLTQSSQAEAGRWIAGPTWSPSFHMSIVDPPERTYGDPTRQVASLGQNIFSDVQLRRRGWRFFIRGITEEELLAQIEPMNLINGIWRDVLVCRNRTSSNLGRDTIWGLQEYPARAAKMSGEPTLWEVEMSVWERN